MQGASLKTICLCVIRHDFVDKHQKSRNILRFCLSFSSMKCVIKVIPPHSSESPFVWFKAGLGSIRLGTMWNWISILDVKIFILFNSLLLGGKVSEWKVQKLTLHIQMFNKFDNFFLLRHFYYTCILDCFIYIFIFSCSHISQTSGWLPPADSWDSGGGLNLPYGWEAAQDQEGKTYYVKWVHFFISLLDSIAHSY